MKYEILAAMPGTVTLAEYASLLAEHEQMVWELNRLRAGSTFIERALDELEDSLLREEYDTPARHVHHVLRVYRRLIDTSTGAPQ